MAEKIDDVLGEYNKSEKLLVDDLLKYKLNYIEAQIRCDELWKLVPYNIHINSGRLNRIMKDQFKNDPNWKYSRTFTIPVGNIPKDEEDKFIKKWIKHSQKPTKITFDEKEQENCG